MTAVVPNECSSGIGTMLFDSANHEHENSSSMEAKTAVGQTVEYYSRTHGRWVPAQVTSADADTGAVQINLKPGVWIVPDNIRPRKHSSTRPRMDTSADMQVEADAAAGTATSSLTKPTLKHTSTTSGPIPLKPSKLTSAADCRVFLGNGTTTAVEGLRAQSPTKVGVTSCLSSEDPNGFPIRTAKPVYTNPKTIEDSLNNRSAVSSVRPSRTCAVTYTSVSKGEPLTTGTAVSSTTVGARTSIRIGTNNSRIEESFSTASTVPQLNFNIGSRQSVGCSSNASIDGKENGLSPRAVIRYSVPANTSASGVAEDRENQHVANGLSTTPVSSMKAASYMPFSASEGYTHSFDKSRDDPPNATTGTSALPSAGVVRRTVVAARCASRDHCRSVVRQSRSPPRPTSCDPNVRARTLLPGSTATADVPLWARNALRSTSPTSSANMKPVSSFGVTASTTTYTGEDPALQVVGCSVSIPAGGCSTSTPAGGCSVSVPAAAMTPGVPVGQRVLPPPQLVSRQAYSKSSVLHSAQGSAYQTGSMGNGVNIYTKPDDTSPRKAAQTATSFTKEQDLRQAKHGPTERPERVAPVVRTSFSQPPPEDVKLVTPRMSTLLHGDVYVRCAVPFQSAEPWANTGSSMKTSAGVPESDPEPLLVHNVEAGARGAHDSIRFQRVKDPHREGEERDCKEAEPTATMIQQPAVGPSGSFGRASTKEGEVTDSTPQCVDDPNVAAWTTKDPSTLNASPSSATYSCPYCGVEGLPSFDAARGHCSATTTSTATSCPRSFSPPQVTQLPVNRIRLSHNSIPARSSASIDATPTADAGQEGAKLLGVREVVRFRCPTCGDLLPSQDEAAQHCGRKQTVMYRCPICGEMLPTREEALAHCSQEDAPCARTPAGADPAVSSDASAPPSAAAASTEAPRTGTSVLINAAQGPPEGFTPLPQGEAIAFNAWGQPMIVRQVDYDKGIERTVVLNEDGTIQAFGENTVQSLVTSTEDDTHKWVGELSDRQLRGLVHEIGQRLLSSSRTYQSHQAALQDASQRAGYAYFGLDETASDKDLDNAYRQKAKKMHPDKNGGTEEAKRKFQYMKERYESLKAKRMEVGHGSGSGQEDKAKGKKDGHDKDNKESRDEGTAQEDDNANERSGEAHGSDDDEKNQPRRKEAYEEDDEEDRPSKEEETDNRKIEYDPHDRGSMQQTVSKMVQQLKVMEQGLAQIQHELKKAWGCAR